MHQHVRVPVRDCHQRCAPWFRTSRVWPHALARWGWEALRRDAAISREKFAPPPLPGALKRGLGPYRILNIEYPTGNIELPTTTSIFLVQYSIFDIQQRHPRGRARLSRHRDHDGLALRVPIGDKGARQWEKAEIDLLLPPPWGWEAEGGCHTPLLNPSPT